MSLRYLELSTFNSRYLSESQGETVDKMELEIDMNTTTDNYHIPYCSGCKQFVNPQVVGATHVYGGSGSAVDSHVSYEKFCPNCGNQVFSQRDIDTRDARQSKTKKDAMQWLILGVAFSGFIFPPTAFIPAIVALILATKNRPLTIVGKGGVALACLVICFFLVAIISGLSGVK